MTIKVCPVCGKQFESYKGGGKTPRKTYCSNECRLRKTETVTLYCQWCGKPFQERPKYLAHRYRKFCSRDCVNAARSEQKRGANNPNYRGGTVQYRGQNWPRQSRLAKVRDGYKCQICGKKVGKRRADHGVHHIKSYRSFNGDWQTANQLTNLITLCKSCHTSVECGGLPCPVPLL